MTDQPRSPTTPLPHPATSAIASLHPAYFAMVMATGIVSISAHLLNLRAIGVALFWLNIVFYTALSVLTAIRVTRYTQNVLNDLRHHGRCVGFFTSVAATNVLGSQCLLIATLPGVATALWLAGVALLAVLTYGIFTILTVKQEKPALAEGLNGGWLLSVVAPQSAAVLGTQLSSGFGEYQEHVLLFCLTLWLGAGMLYIWIISLVFYRYTFFVLAPSDLAPPYWINMGAVAISTLAGTVLLSMTPKSALLAGLEPFIKGLTLLYWSTATLWIPMLIILGVWRHLIRRFPVKYDPLFWGAVFPLGMYTACTYRLAGVVHAPILGTIPTFFVYVALGAWAATFAGYLYALRSRR